VPVAVSRKLNPRGTDEFWGVIDMEDRGEAVTVSVVFPDVLPKAAVIVVIPAFKATARPLPFTVATEVFEEVQIT
jgi:hypothetical protein